MKPIVYDGYCGLGGWTEGFLAAGYRCVGFDIEAHDYGTGGYSGELILRDMRQVHGSLLKDATCLVFSPPCQEYSYMAMPWSLAKQIARALQGQDEFPAGYHGSRTIEQLNELFNTSFRIQREACEAAGRYIPMVVENVRGAQKWVGRAKANYGSYYLWGDVGMVGNRVVCVVNGKLLGHGVAPVKALKNGGSGQWFPIGRNGEHVANMNPVNGQVDGRKNDGSNQASKIPGFRFDGSGGSFQSAAVKTTGHANLRDGHTHTRHLTNQAESDALKVPGIKLSDVGFNVAAAQRYPETQRESDAVKFSQTGDAWFDRKPRDTMLGHHGPAAYGSKSNSRKAASAMIAKIPLALSTYVAQSFLLVDA